MPHLRALNQNATFYINFSVFVVVVVVSCYFCQAIVPCIIVLLLTIQVTVKPGLVAYIYKHSIQEEGRLPQAKGYQEYIGLCRK